ncbi:MAG TPA: hypothetical protein VFK09_02905 [Gemmatimonadales bacterium]|nr:hypothetical protein [Gemmatimonadales bacterium]
MPDTPSVPASLPLSLLEAIRNLDTPVEDGLEVLAEEMVQRRLGLSSTVAARINRYRGAAAREGVVPGDELVSVLRLVGRRPDAALVFADAGRRAARYAVRAGARTAQSLIRLGPPGLARRVAVRTVRRLARGYFGAEAPAGGPELEFRMSDSLSVVALPDGAGCGFYGAAFGELLRSLAGFEGAMVHERCRGRGDPACVWRAQRAGGYE